MLAANLQSKATIVGNERIRLKTVGPIIEDSGGLCAINPLFSHIAHYDDVKKGKIEYL